MPEFLPHTSILCPGVRFGLLLVLLIIQTACAPAISKQLQQQADQSLSFPVLTADTEAYTGKVVILGGVIAQTIAKAGQTELEIVQKNLDYFNEPETTDRSEGRFLVRTDRFLDPLIYKKDRKITVAGEVTGSEVRKLDEMEYHYPVIASRELKLWPQPSPAAWGFGGTLGWGPCGFGLGPYGYWGWSPGPPYCP